MQSRWHSVWHCFGERTQNAIDNPVAGFVRAVLARRRMASVKPATLGNEHFEWSVNAFIYRNRSACDSLHCKIDASPDRPRRCVDWTLHLGVRFREVEAHSIVVDGDDQCPNTQAGAVVDATGCEEKDSDMDGILDKNDACPDTPEGAKVDAQGCAEKLTVEVRENLYIAFPSNSSAVPQESVKELENIARLMKEYPSTELQVFGHTDSRGSASYNMQLSDARASAVGKVLSAEYDISLTRINSQGMGETAPVATNDTPEGRAENRRVELVLRQPE